jgi:hypothetical protein
MEIGFKIADHSVHSFGLKTQGNPKRMEIDFKRDGDRCSGDLVCRPRKRFFFSK